jgi:putative transposase
MPDYRRNRVPGGTFFTVNLRDPCSDLLVTQIDISRDGVRRARARTPFRIDAWGVLPDHMDCLWTLPRRDADFPVTVARNQKPHS